MKRYATEHKLLDDVDKKLRARGTVVIPIVASAMQMPGLPDRYYAHVGLAAWVEWKIDSNVMSADQTNRVMAFLSKGTIAFGCRYVNATDTLQAFIPASLSRPGTEIAIPWTRRLGEDVGLTVLKYLKEISKILARANYEDATFFYSLENRHVDGNDAVEFFRTCISMLHEENGS